MVRVEVASGGLRAKTDCRKGGMFSFDICCSEECCSEGEEEEVEERERVASEEVLK